MRVLITGGAGYIGTELIYQLDENHKIKEIIIYDNLSRDNRNLFIGIQKASSKVRFILGDLLDSRKLKKALDKIDIVYHLAAKVSTPFSDQRSHEFEQVNNWGTAELVYAIEENSTVKKLIYLSSASVYGASNEMMDLNSIPNPQTFYGITKLRGEAHINRLSEKIEIFILRCANVYGYSKSMRFDAVINKFMFEANFNKKISIHGDGMQYRAFIHIDKVAEALSNILFSNLKSGVYHLSENNLNVMDIVDEIKQICPEMEMLFVNQHLKLKEIRVNPDERINQLFSSKLTLKEELINFKNSFTFYTD